MQILLHLHSILRWIILLLIVLVIINSLIGFTKNKLFTLSDNKLSLYLLIASHTMLLIGLVQYIFGQKGIMLIKNFGMKTVISTTPLRFFAVEHAFTMILAILLIHIGRVKMKKANNDNSKHKLLFWYTLIALVLILVRMPWPFMQAGIAGAWY
jgi:hypothetical protein